MKHTRHFSLSGFVTLYAVLTAAILLAVGSAIFTIAYHETVFATLTRDSNTALYSADAAEECALYWDFQGYGISGYHIFATSTDSTTPPTGVAYCAGVDIETSPWTVTKTASAATTTFTLQLPPTCAVVTVAKYTQGGVGTPIRTAVVANGYNTCAMNAASRIQRTLQADY